MMKRFLLILSALFLLFGTACGNKPDGPAPAQEPTPAVSTAPAEEAVMYLKVAWLYDNAFLGMGVGDKATAGELYFVPTANADAGTLSPGMLVRVLYNGMVQESYPATLGEPSRITPAQMRDDLVGFYLGVLRDLYEQDTALNDGITILGFDLSGAVNLTDSEKAALMYLLGCEYGMETVSGTYEELCERGYINEEEMFFPEGVLFNIDRVDVKSDAEFTFSASKWRSGLGAIGIDRCKARKTDGAWTYTPGGTWVA